MPMTSGSLLSYWAIFDFRPYTDRIKYLPIPIVFGFLVDALGSTAPYSCRIELANLGMK
jgi:hypothetical protein